MHRPTRRTFIQQVGLAAISSTKLAKAALAADTLIDTNRQQLRWFILSDHEVLLDLRIGLLGFTLATNWRGRYSWLLDDGALPGVVVIEFPPQHLYEETFFETSAHERPPALGKVNGVFSNRTRLAFQLRSTAKRARIPFTLDALLDWEGNFEFIVPGDNSPEPTETLVEVPAGIQLAIPNSTYVWEQPVHGKGKVNELWHVRLRPTAYPYLTVQPVRSLPIRHNPTLIPHQASGCAPSVPGQFPGSLSDGNRAEIVSVFGHVASSPNECSSPVAPQAELLLFSSIGAWLDVDARHPSKPFGCTADLEAWRHKVEYGRDQFVRLESPIYLYPYGIRAKLIKLTVRRMHSPGDGSPGAFLRTEYFIERIRNEIVTNAELDMPFEQIALDIDRSPPLDISFIGAPCDEPNLAGSFDANWEKAFWPTVSGRPYLFPICGTDKAGAFFEALPTAVIVVPFAYLDSSTGHMQPELGSIVDAEWQRPANLERRLVDVQGRKISIARPERSGDTRLETQSIEFVRGIDTSGSGGNPPKKPFVARAHRCTIESQALTTLSSSPKRMQVCYRYAPSDPDTERSQPRSEYVDPDASDCGLFVTLVDAVPFEFAESGANRSGGIATPGLRIHGLSRRTGPVSSGQVTRAAHISRGGASTTTNLGEIFDGVNAKLLGGLQLSTLFQYITARDLGDVPALQYRLPNIPIEQLLPNLISPSSVQVPFADMSEPVEPKETISASLSWHYDWEDAAPDVLIFRPHGSQRFGDDIPATFAIDVQASLNVRTGVAQYSMSGELRHFQILLPLAASPWVSISFDHVSFEMAADGGHSFEPHVLGFEFEGQFAFFESLRDWLKDLGGNGLKIDLSPQGISVQSQLALPTIAIGAVVVSNLRFVYGIRVPFTDDPLLTEVGLATRADPFVVSVDGFAGGGFLRFLLGSDEPKELEVAIEFGGNLQADFGGVASGKASVMAGIYYGLKLGVAILQGYVRAQGVLDVLRIGSVSVVAYLRLSYDPGSGSAKGSVEVTVTIKIGFADISQSFTVEQQINGSGQRALTGDKIKRSQAIDNPIPFDSDPRSSDSWDYYWRSFNLDSLHRSRA